MMIVHQFQMILNPLSWPTSLVYTHPKNVSKRFQKDISSRTKDIEQFSQLTTHTHTQD